MQSIFKHKRLVLALGLACGVLSSAQAEDKKPNIVIIWGDDIGQSNVSAYSKGVMGYKTPNIDRVANEGVLFTDYYAESLMAKSTKSTWMVTTSFRI
jgi:arylsulfatase